MLVDLPPFRTFSDLSYGTVFTFRKTNGEQYTAIKVLTQRREGGILVLSHTFDSPSKSYPLPTAYPATQSMIEGIVTQAHTCTFRVHPEFIDLFGDKHPQLFTHDGCGYVYITIDPVYLCILDLSTKKNHESQVALSGGMEQDSLPVALLDLMTNTIVSNRLFSATILRITNTWSLVEGERVVFSHPNVGSTS